MERALYEYLRDYVTEERLARFEQILGERTRHLTVVLEDIFHPPNAGAVIRSAECFGIQDIYVIENTKPFHVNTNVVKGSAKWITMHRYSDSADCTEQCIKDLKSRGYKIAATTLRDDLPMITPEEIPVDEPVALCMGCEETGLSEHMHEHADYYVHIPMCGFTQSLNISVSAALCLRSMVNRLHSSDIDWSLTDDAKQELRETWICNSIKHLEKLINHYNENLAGK